MSSPYEIVGAVALAGFVVREAFSLLKSKTGNSNGNGNAIYKIDHDLLVAMAAKQEQIAKRVEDCNKNMHDLRNAIAEQTAEMLRSFSDRKSR